MKEHHKDCRCSELECPYEDAGEAGHYDICPCNELFGYGTVYCLCDCGRDACEKKRNLILASPIYKEQEKIMRELTPKVIESFSIEERQLFRANLLDENRNWTENAKRLSVDMFLNQNKEKLVELAKEIVKEEQANMFGSLLQVKE